MRASKRRSSLGAAVLGALFAACTCDAASLAPSGTSGGALASAEGPAGEIPAGLPARLLIGLGERDGHTWMRDSGVPWDVRYVYFTKGWVENYVHGPRDGSWALGYLRATAAQGFIPAVTYYQLHDEPGGGEPRFYVKTRDAATMRSYFSDVKVLMAVARDFGKPVILHIEPDGFALLQQQTLANPNAPAAIAATGLPELRGLPDTVAGFGLAFLQLRKAVGAQNVILGMHVSAWSSGKDIAHSSITEPLEPEVDKTLAFLGPLGLQPNRTGETYDILVGDPLDRDADFFRLEQGDDRRWWSPADGAPVASRSFNRYAEWMRLFNRASGKRWVLWQIPLGNSHHLNVENRGGLREGFRDNRTEYFFGPDGRRHLARFVDAGAIALLFGPGKAGQSSYTNDADAEGELFLKSRAGRFLKAGGLAIPRAATQPASAPRSN